VVPGSIIANGYYPWILVGIFLIIWVYDSMAYLFGSLLGKHKIYESISPKKSWEGLVGGTVFALLTAYFNSLVFTEMDIARWMGISVLVVIFGTCGDFFESKLKRECGIKDTGTILPGHGGMLDRFDTVLFTTPVIYVWLNLFGNF
jgi:phosphatidate cytidylyltransferase